MTTAQDFLDHLAEILIPVKRINAFSCLWFPYLEHSPYTGIPRKNDRICINDQQSFLHVFGDDLEFFLVSACRFKLCLDLAVLLMDPAEERTHFLIDLVFFRVIQIQFVDRFNDICRHTRRCESCKEQHYDCNTKNRGNKLKHQCKDRRLCACHTKDRTIGKL